MAAGGDGDAEGPIVVALTASAGGAGSLEALLRALPPQPAAALVAVLQHRERLDEERFWRAASAGGHRRAALGHDAPVEPGRLYLPGPGLIVTLEDGHFRTRPAEEGPNGGAGARGAIDSFLVSLARERDGRSVAVALAGTDGDGTLGLREVKDAGGMTLAEDTPESRAGALDFTDSPAALADAVLPVEALAPRLAALVAQLAAERGGPSAPETVQALADIAAALRAKTGHDFHGYKPGTFQRRVQRRMQFLGLEDVRAYLGALRASPDEARSLFNDLLIGVTDFFRDPREWEALEAEVVPRLFEGKGPRDPVRAWVAGCSTGEEAYSLAILLAEGRARLDNPPPVQIFASDLDGRALAQARAGRYPDTIALRMSPERLGRWFVREGDTFCVAKELREMCVFSRHSIIKDAPFSRLDLVSCRNLLIYLGAGLQERVIPIFHFALGPGGFLFLGSSENVSRHPGLFAPLGGRSRIFRRLDAATRTLPDFPFATGDRRSPAMAAPAEAPDPGSRRPDPGDLARLAERAVERHAPAHVIVDGSHMVLHFSGNMGRFLAPSGGAASLSLPTLVHPALRADLRTTLATAEAENRAVEARGLEVTAGGARRDVDLVVEPLPPGADGQPGFVVIFKDMAPRPGGEGAGGPGPERDERSPELVDELRATRDRLRATVEELETTNEELKSSNEEYQSLNEELQSANEELETSKEEMQSLNEELTTVNGELAHRVHELARANSDLKNFLEATQIATLFLDNELRVTNFTPATGELFHLVESDLGRLIAHVRPRVVYDELADDARRVLRTLQPVEREVGGAGARFMARVLPYRSTDNYIAGVVLTFTDVTARREMEERGAFLLRLSDALRPLADPVAITATATRLLGERLGASRAYYAEWPPGADHAEIARDHAAPGLASLAGRYPIAAFRTTYDRVSTGTTWIVEDNATAPGIGDGERAYHQEAGVVAWVDVPLVKDGLPRAVLCVVQDRPRQWARSEVALVEEAAERLWAAVERARAEGAMRASEERLQIALDAADMGTFVWHVAEDRTEQDARARAHFGLAPDGTVSLADALATTFHPEDGPPYAAVVARALDPAGPGTLHEEFRIRRADGQERWVSVTATTQFEGQPPVAMRLAGVLSDVTERKRAEARLRDSEERFRAIVETARDHAIFTTDPEGRIETWPPGAQEVFGWTAAEAVGQLVDMTFTPEDRAAGAPDEERRAAREDGQAPNVRWHLRKDGARVFIEGVTRPLRGTGGLLTGFVKVGQDVTERRATEDALRESELRFRTLSEGIPQLVWTAVDYGSWTWASPQWTAFTGQPEADSHGWGWLETLHPDDHEGTRAAWERSKATGAFEADYRLREAATGEFRWFQTRAAPVRDEGGAIVEWLGTCTDVQDLREMQERQGVLVAELQHRTRNLMGVVRAVTDRTIEGSRSLPDFHARIRDRLGALARVNGLLSRLHEGRRITFDELLRVELRGHGVIDGEGRGRQVTLDGPAGVRLRSSTVQTLALGLHELATNALKYGALSRPEGRLRVGWDVVDGADGARRLRVDWRESGVAVPAPDGGAPRRGYGRELIERALPYQLKAETTYALTPDGVRCTITLPVSAPASPGLGEDLSEGGV